MKDRKSNKSKNLKYFQSYTKLNLNYGFLKKQVIGLIELYEDSIKNKLSIIFSKFNKSKKQNAHLKVKIIKKI